MPFRHPGESLQRIWEMLLRVGNGWGVRFGKSARKLEKWSRDPRVETLSAKRGISMGEWLLSRRDSTIVARHEYLFSALLNRSIVLVVLPT
jgi:hypothetical protein